MGRTGYRVAAGVFLLAWLATLKLHVATTTGYSTAKYDGDMVFTLGWAGLLQLQAGWYANLVLFATCALIFVPRFISAKEARAAMWLLLALGTNVLFWRGLSRVERQGYDPITVYGPGYYAWLLVMLAAILLLWHRQYVFVEEPSE